MPNKSPFTKIKGGVCAPNGFQAAAVSAGIKNPDDPRLDLALIYSEAPCVAAGTFTTNRVKAAPVKVSQAYMKADQVQAIVANSGNANACTGVEGISDSRKTAKIISKCLGLRQRQIAICSTGVIGLPMPMTRIEPKLPELVENLSPKNGEDVARAIMTSDTCKKEISVAFDCGEHRVRIGACAKGAGMICPSMATMLCFITTDANVHPDCLQKAVQEAVEMSFNRITIDGDMSTNDTVIVLANGQSGMPAPARNSEECRKLREALVYVMTKMAKSLVRDGERVTKFVTVEVKGAKTYLDAKKVAEAVANSALVKSSWNGNDPNWGRIIHAVGYSRASVREELIDIHINGKPACLGGLQAKTQMETLRNIVAKDEFTITINLNRGNAEYEVYTSDLSPEYIDFNRSEYAYWKQARKDGLV
ncbi:bifunctional glutamate N-acetyltransferase/amino-acid acetyltransferase ArgJ [Verrucomicrobiaceae bacterium R5-34]|uniref:Arginine biosynthesis bifunctional protein ArgJ n=1 Tax=Oceaniferula flava TaxID=2800421 RepID=A0AAE2VCF6_9BACT|nr:bifunctional glutamate N-acetyltransferase/amino-acid acetyltransferase ArgJ [Oceaniferula flavus]MBK1831394.1 bifunctional glutamate N-acetyltransferase/amino-acid acetyltransferase ArgJ [Verrucomicrobiaceae bacterium R5-34]MBK1854936.1 bifunctional glutamate N-acetyltransferase/amino-acid acetyltransferase ArgJ [Oceaniferula flavus]MBM1136242.1 bifunctional glutamate N-acetyltransferase/amino-acid acetyltransferase ArgJ [Oceaniferula flavus]